MNRLEEAKVLQKTGEDKEAEKLLKAMLIDSPQNIDAIYLLSNIIRKQNKGEEAEELLDKALEIDSTNIQVLQAKGSSLLSNGEQKRAMSYFKKALKINPNLYGAQVVVANIHFFEGERESAIKHYNMAKKTHPTFSEANIGLAKIYMNDGDVQKGILTLREIELNSKNQLTVIRMMGLLYLEQGAYAEAEKYFLEVLKIIPDDDITLLYLGLVKLQEKNTEEADKLIFNFNEKHRNTADGLAAIGLLMFYNNRYDLAIEYLEKATTKGLFPFSWKEALYEAKAKTGLLQTTIEFYRGLDYQSSKTNFRLGELFQQTNQDEKAINQFEKIKEKDPYYLTAIINISRCHANTNNKEKAYQTYLKVLKYIPDHPEAIMYEINYLLEKDKTEKAIKKLQSINENKIDELYVREFRLIKALILDHQQKYDAAMKLFDKTKSNNKGKIAFKKISENEINTITRFNSIIKDNRSEPIIVTGLESTGIKTFTLWLASQGLQVLNDRLKGKGRNDVLSKYQEINFTNQLDDENVWLERKKYFQKARAQYTDLKTEETIVDCMFTNLYQLALVKKFFPKAKVILLCRDTPDIWLSQKIIETEQIDSCDWNEAKNQIISMGLNLVQIDMDSWLNSDKDTMEKLDKIFNRDLKIKTKDTVGFWKKTHFKKGHWKNYKQFLGK